MALGVDSSPVNKWGLEGTEVSFKIEGRKVVDLGLFCVGGYHVFR
ncbi:hypothetical protein C240_14 [Enterococcus sp. 5H]|nr:hypothetical protein [Enterococcus sp. 5H]